MGYAVLPIALFTALWGIVGIVCPFFAPKGPNRGIIQVVLILTAATCWLFWLCAYMAQMNPLIGPRLNNETLIWMSRTWVRAGFFAIFFFALRVSIKHTYMNSKTHWYVMLIESQPPGHPFQIRWATPSRTKPRSSEAAEFPDDT